MLLSADPCLAWGVVIDHGLMIHRYSQFLSVLAAAGGYNEVRSEEIHHAIGYQASIIR